MDQPDIVTVETSLIVENTVALIRNRLPHGCGSKYCRSCTEEIPIERRHALPGVVYCIDCQNEKDRKFVGMF